MSRWRRVPPALAATLALAVLVIVLAARHPRLMNAQFASNLVNDHVVLGLVAIGAALVLIAGSIDLSVGAVMALCSTALAATIRAGLDPAAAVLVALAIGAAFGAAHGALVTRLSVPPFIATLAGMFLARGLSLKLSPEAIAIGSPRFREWCQARIEIGARFDLTLLGGAFVLAVVVAQFVLARTPFGRDLYAVGGDAHAAELLGVRTRRVTFSAHVLSGLLAGAAGVAFALFGASGNPSEGVGLELEAIAAAVAGGVALSGGRGSALGAAVGVVMFGVIRTFLLAEGTSDAGTYRVAVGALLFVFLGVQRAISAR